MEKTLWQSALSLYPQKGAQISLYVRKVNKQAIRIKVTVPIEIASLKGIVSSRFKYKCKEFALFYNGQRIDQL